MNYSQYEITKKLKISKQYLYKLRNSIPLNEGLDFFYIQIGLKKNYLYTSSGIEKIKKHNKKGVKNVNK